ncbi:MFS transporter [Lipingzhangella sp. LS1_29]|uniref:MFS transporter n=1 Tax=Lipingzhangella rawalii TaxID=2055835 RepID=A0ABU2H3V4_9ACTN|nr:MFS transporter [Lipingzhangella rawalii]MDS1269529.1 MFS transporter [Lipingzhangella rawalii]
MDQAAAHPRRWVILGVLVLALLVVVLDHTILNVALRVIADPQQGIGATQSELQWAINSYTLVFAGLLFTFGVLGDRWGRKRMLVAGLVVFGASSGVSAFAQTPEQLIAARALMGLGAAGIMPQTLAILTNVFSPEQRGRAIGIWAGAVGMGMAIGPPLGGLLLTYFWWGSIFLINVPVAVFAVAMILWLAPESRNPEPGRLDPVGVLLSIIGLVLLVYGIIGIGERGQGFHPETILALCAGLAVLAAFVVYEARIDHPAFNVRLFRDPRLAVAVATIMLVFFAMAGVVFFMSFYLQSVQEFNPLQAGLLLIPMAAAQAVFAPLSSTLVSRFGPKLVGTVGVLLVAVALGSYATVDVATPVLALCAIFFVQGTGMALVMPPATESIMSTVPRHEAGAASAMQNTARQVAVALGVAVLGSVVSLVYRGQISEHLDVLPQHAQADAASSIEETLGTARALGLEAELVQPAKDAFLAGMHTSALCSLVVALISAVTVLIWLPRRARPQDVTQQPDPRGAPGAAESATASNPGATGAPESVSTRRSD